MQVSRDVQRGWEFSAEVLGADLGAYVGAEYIVAVEAAIRQLEDNINSHRYRNLGIEQLQGYMLEEWGAGTFNVDAAAADSPDYATILRSTLKDSVDIHLDSGVDYSAKSYGSAEQTAKAQARFDINTGQASYCGQGRLVPADQLDGAKSAAHHEALRNQPIREEVSKAYSETEAKLTDVIENREGVKSRGIGRKELESIAEESKRQGFSAAEHGVTIASAIQLEYLLKQATKAGYTAAAITIAVQLTPEIFKAIDYLIRNGELNPYQIKEMGEKGISIGAEGFLRGSISSVLFIMCKEGIFGEVLKCADPTMLGAFVALVLQTVKNSILVAAGKMAPREMGAAFVDTAIMSIGYVIGTRIGGIIGQALGFELPVVGYLLGSLIGASFCAVYNIGKKKLISFCVDTGFTCFGLVGQSYELPEEVLSEIGIETIPIPRARIEITSVPRATIKIAGIEKSSYETIDITVLRRGVIGVNKVGYVVGQEVSCP